MIVAGSIYLVYCGHITDPKDKFCLVVATEPKLRYFFINTEPSPLAANNAKLAPTQVRILRAEHPFLAYDSWVDCRDPQGGRLEDWQEEVAQDAQRVKGQASPALLGAVIASIEASPTIAAKQAEQMLAELRPLIAD
jgi:hypothetical protein